MTSGPAPLRVGGYVLAGGQSSRMGQDKALLSLGGKPLVQHAVSKLRRVCREVAILSARPELADFGRLVPDRHPGCGPLAGMEAALLETQCDWNLFLPVDVPFLPTIYLRRWLEMVGLPEVMDRDGSPHPSSGRARVVYWTVDGRSHPTVALLHRSVAPYLTAALRRGEYKLQPALEQAAGAAALEAGFPSTSGLRKLPYWPDFRSRPESGQTAQGWWFTTTAQEEGHTRWFSNLNTPEEFAEAERHLEALDT